MAQKHLMDSYESIVQREPEAKRARASLINLRLGTHDSEYHYKKYSQEHVQMLEELSSAASE